jgi:hypothetical protein
MRSAPWVTRPRLAAGCSRPTCRWCPVR